MTTHGLTAADTHLTGDTPPRDARPTSRVYEVAIGIAVTIFGGALCVATQNIDLAREGQSFGPRWWPTALAIAMMVLGLVLVVQALASRITTDEPAITRSGASALCVTLLAIVVYGTSWHYFDFRVVTVLLLAALTAISGGRGIKALVLFPVVTTAILWGIFGILLQVPL